MEEGVEQCTEADMRSLLGKVLRFNKVDEESSMDKNRQQGQSKWPVTHRNGAQKGQEYELTDIVRCGPQAGSGKLNRLAC